MNTVRDKCATESATGEIRRVLERLNWWSNRCAGHVTEQRVAKRQECSVPIRLSVPISKGEFPPHFPTEIVFESFSRNVSATGVSFVVPLEINPERDASYTNSINSERVLKPRHRIRVGFFFSDEGITWLLGEVIRTKRVDAKFLEVGVRFIKRVPAP